MRAARGGALGQGGEGGGGPPLLAAREPDLRLGGERGREPGPPRQPVGGEVERLVVEAVVEDQQREEPLGAERVGRRGGAGGEERVAGAGDVAAGQGRLHGGEGPRPSSAASRAARP